MCTVQKIVAFYYIPDFPQYLLPWIIRKWRPFVKQPISVIIVYVQVYKGMDESGATNKTPRKHQATVKYANGYTLISIFFLTESIYLWVFKQDIYSGEVIYRSHQGSGGVALHSSESIELPCGGPAIKLFPILYINLTCQLLSCSRIQRQGEITDLQAI